jgi:hypothetical protein|tara:strand:- start:1919 stop:2131 length:213 start_codon:yes stop_codon:yes gene_type:complete
MKELGRNLLEATNSMVESEIQKDRANLSILLENPVGIGEHIDLVADVYKLVDGIAHKEDVLDTVRTLLRG